MTKSIKDEAFKAIADLFGPTAVPTTRNAPPTEDGDSNLPTTSLKGAGYLGNLDQTPGTTMNPIAQLGLFAKVRKSHGWLRTTQLFPVTEEQGYLDLWDDRGFVMKPTAKEGPRPGIPLHKPDLSQVSFATKHMSGAFGLRLRAIRAAAARGQNPNALIQEGLAAGIGNVFADLGINGDMALPADSALNIQRGTVDGWFKKIRQDGQNYTGLNDGIAYHNGLWSAMNRQLDQAYRSSPNLAWGMTDSLANRWLMELTATGLNPSNAHPSIINQLGSQLLNQLGTQANPIGKPGMVIPQMADDQHSSGEGYSGIAPTSVTNNGNGTLTININTLGDSGVDRSATGLQGQRYVRIGCILTGREEVLAVDYSAPNNTVTTSTLLGQTVASTTAANYYVKWADCQSLFHGAMNMLGMVIQNGMRIYTVFYPQDETIDVIVHADLDYLVIDQEAVSLVDDIITPRTSVLG